jgi:hypothetical protein
MVVGGITRGYSALGMPGNYEGEGWTSYIPLINKTIDTLYKCPK